MEQKDNPEHQGKCNEFKSCDVHLQNMQTAPADQYQNTVATQEKKLAKDLNGCILKEGIEMAIKPMKRCSASLLENANQTAARYQLTPSE